MKVFFSLFILLSCSFDTSNSRVQWRNEENNLEPNIKTVEVLNENYQYNEFRKLFYNEFKLPIVFGQDYVFDLKNETFNPFEYRKLLGIPINDLIFTSSYMESEYYSLGFIKSREQRKDFLLLGFFEPPFKRSITLLICDNEKGNLDEKIVLWEDDQVKKRIISEIGYDYIANITYIFDTRNILDNEIKSNEASAYLKKSRIKINPFEIIEDSPIEKTNLIMDGNKYILPK